MEIKVDPQDEWLLDAYKFYIRKPTKSSGSKTYYAQANLSRKVGGGNLVLHHAIMGRALDGLVIDHRNRNGLDCRRKNLRYISHAKNCVNTSRLPGKSGIRGVYERYRLTPNGTEYHEIHAVYRGKRLGTFRNIVDAENAYIAAKELDFQ